MQKIPQIGLGTWKIGKTVVEDVVYRAIKDHGVRHIDCACDYGNEAEVGRALHRVISEGVVKREDLWVTSKLWNTYHRSEHVEAACKKSLNDLQLEYFDLYLIHFPIAMKFVPFEQRYPPEWIHDPNDANPRIELDPAAPMHKTWEAMEGLVASNLTRRIGVANFCVQLLMDLLSYAKISPYVNQVELHPFLTQQALVDFCRSRGIEVTAFSPLGSPSYIELNMDFGEGVGLLQHPTILKAAAANQKTPAQVLLRWNLQRGVSVIPKSCQTLRIAENMGAADFSLTEEQMTEISALNKNLRFNDPGVFCAFMGGAIPIYA